MYICIYIFICLLIHFYVLTFCITIFSFHSFYSNSGLSSNLYFIVVVGGVSGGSLGGGCVGRGSGAFDGGGGCSNKPLQDMH